MAASDIPLARQALSVLRRGGTPDRLQSEALDRVDRLADAARPLSSYAPRTQRRYLAAAAVGANAHTANRIDYEQKRLRRRTGIPGVQHMSYRDRIAEQAERNGAALSDGGLGQYDDDQLDVLVELVGLRGALAILRMQWDSIEEFKRSNPEPGRQRWYDRPDIVERYRKGLGHDEYTVPYFWYRARK